MASFQRLDPSNLDDGMTTIPATSHLEDEKSIWNQFRKAENQVLAPVGRGGDGWGCSHHLVGAEQRTLGNDGHYWSHCTGGGCCEAVVLLVQPQIILRVRAMLFERFAHVLFFLLFQLDL